MAERIQGSSQAIEGEGFHVSIEQPVKVDLQLFPDRLVVRYRNLIAEVGQRQEEQASPEPEAPAEESEADKKRVEFTGRLGVAPELKKSRAGKDYVRLPIAVKAEGQEKADWKDLYFYGERAVKAAEEVKKGQLLAVVAYETQREVEGKQGKRVVTSYNGVRYSIITNKQ